MNATAKPREKLGRRLKILGGMTILLSFVTQNFLYDRWDSRRSGLRAAIDERAIIDKSVLLDEILYFTVSLPQGTSDRTNEVKRFKINEAARKMATSSMMPVVYSDSLTIQQKTTLANQLFAEVRTVSDYDSFLKFIQFVNDGYGRYSKEIKEQDQRLGGIRDLARWTYLGLYLLGSCTLLAALRYG
jgi:hypothetical protein